MLIRRIKSLQNFGIYNGFAWNANADEFSDKNIIYGWNYSGKTTLSRFLQLLSVVSDEDAKKIGFKVSYFDDSHKTLDAEQRIEGLKVYVFNNDYIEGTLHFGDKVNRRIKGISFDIGEASSETRAQLVQTNSEISEETALMNELKQVADSLNDFEKEFTKEARRIKNEEFQSQIEFTKAHFKKLVEKISSSEIDLYIITDPIKLREFSR